MCAYQVNTTASNNHWMTAFIVHLHVVLVYRYFVYAYIGSFFLCFGLLCTNKKCFTSLKWSFWKTSLFLCWDVENKDYVLQCLHLIFWCQILYHVIACRPLLVILTSRAFAMVLTGLFMVGFHVDWDILSTWKQKILFLKNTCVVADVALVFGS